LRGFSPLRRDSDFSLSGLAFKFHSGIISRSGTKSKYYPPENLTKGTPG
jgi:hypothetical protein